MAVENAIRVAVGAVKYIFSANSAFSAVNLKCGKVKLVLVISNYDRTGRRQTATGRKSLPQRRRTAQCACLYPSEGLFTSYRDASRHRASKA